MLVAPRWPAADLRSDIAAEARAKITYERLIKVCDDAGLKDTLNFLMSREVAHQKMFEAALDSLQANFPPGTLSGDEKLNHAYFQDVAPTAGRYGRCWSWVISGEVGRLLDWGSVSVYRDVVGTAQRRLLPLAGAGSLSVPAAGLPTVQEALTTRGGRR